MLRLRCMLGVSALAMIACMAREDGGGGSRANQLFKKVEDDQAELAEDLANLKEAIDGGDTGDTSTEGDPAPADPAPAVSADPSFPASDVAQGKVVILSALDEIEEELNARFRTGGDLIINVHDAYNEFRRAVDQLPDN